jgi:hypothetical protein
LATYIGGALSSACRFIVLLRISDGEARCISRDGWHGSERAIRGSFGSRATFGQTIYVFQLGVC